MSDWDAVEKAKGKSQIREIHDIVRDMKGCESQHHPCSVRLSTIRYLASILTLENEAEHGQRKEPEGG